MSFIDFLSFLSGSSPQAGPRKEIYNGTSSKVFAANLWNSLQKAYQKGKAGQVYYNRLILLIYIRMGIYSKKKGAWKGSQHIADLQNIESYRLEAGYSSGTLYA